MLSDLLTPGISITEKLIRTIAVYGFLLLGLRLAGKREMSQLNSFDLVVLLLISNTLQNAIIGNDNSLIGGLIGAAFLLIINTSVIRWLFRHHKLDALEGKPEVLVKNGRMLKKHLDREMITVRELEAAARRQGIESLAHVQECRLETGGALTFVQHHPTDDERRHHETISLLAEMQHRQEEMAAQLARLQGPAAASGS
jgi:uncharacterized membrane protein YcaP (DUF421 family)